MGGCIDRRRNEGREEEEEGEGEAEEEKEAQKGSNPGNSTSPAGGQALAGRYWQAGR